MYHGICLMPKDHDKFSHQKYQERTPLGLLTFVTSHLRKIPPVSRTCLKCIFSYFFPIFQSGCKTWGLPNWRNNDGNFSKAQSSSLCASLGFWSTPLGSRKKVGQNRLTKIEKRLIQLYQPGLGDETKNLLRDIVFADRKRQNVNPWLYVYIYIIFQNAIIFCLQLR